MLKFLYRCCLFFFYGLFIYLFFWKQLHLYMTYGITSCGRANGNLIILSKILCKGFKIFDSWLFLEYWPGEVVADHLVNRSTSLKMCVSAYGPTVSLCRLLKLLVCRIMCFLHFSEITSCVSQKLMFAIVYYWLLLSLPDYEAYIWSVLVGKCIPNAEFHTVYICRIMEYILMLRDL